MTEWGEREETESKGRTGYCEDKGVKGEWRIESRTEAGKDMDQKEIGSESESEKKERGPKSTSRHQLTSAETRRQKEGPRTSLITKRKPKTETRRSIKE